MNVCISAWNWLLNAKEVQQELSHLASEGYVTANGSQYGITTSGQGELQSVQQHLETLYHEVVQNKKAVPFM